MRCLLICLFLLSLAGPARAGMEGQPTIVDGDTPFIIGADFGSHPGTIG